MLPALFRTRATRRCVWMLWLALLLPAAQAVAAWHAHSHTRADVEAGAGDPRLAHLQACELCLTLAGVAHAAPPPLPSVPAVLRLGPVAAPVLPAPADGVAALLAYQGRAPPASSR